MVSEQFSQTLHNIGIVFYLLNHAVNPYVYFIFFYRPRHTGNADRSSSSTSENIPDVTSARGGTCQDELEIRNIDVRFGEIEMSGISNPSVGNSHLETIDE